MSGIKDKLVGNNKGSSDGGLRERNEHEDVTSSNDNPYGIAESNGLVSSCHSDTIEEAVCSTTNNNNCVSSSSSSSSVSEINSNNLISQTMNSQQPQGHYGSSISGAIFNYTNCIVGAGAIGLGGAFGQSGGLISVASVLLFAFLVKLSTDLVVEMSIALSNDNIDSRSVITRRLATYEDLGYVSYGTFGKMLVLGAKYFYSLGCLIAYTKVIEDNFCTALKHIIFASDTTSESWLWYLLNHETLTTYIVSTLVVLPLCLLRDMAPLAKFSILSVIAMGVIVSIVLYYWIHGDTIKSPSNYMLHESNNSLSSEDSFNFVSNLASSNTTNTYTKSEIFYAHWIKIYWGGYLSNVGTFVFSFVCQHTAHNTFNSLKPKLRSLKQWKRVSSSALVISAFISLSLGMLVYMTFWEDAVSDIFQLYPPGILMDTAKLLLCITMLLTFPIPFMTCRELMIVLACSILPEQRNNDEDLTRSNNHQRNLIETRYHSGSDEDTLPELQEPLLVRQTRSLSNGEETMQSFYTARSEVSFTDTSRIEIVDDNNLFVDQNVGNQQNLNIDSPDISTSPSVEPVLSIFNRNRLLRLAIDHVNLIFLSGSDYQLKLPYHIGITIKLWFVATSVAVTSPSLGDILALVGCVSGTLIAFILPGLFSIKLRGIQPFPVFILAVGGIVGIVGTACSFRKLISDMAL